MKANPFKAYEQNSVMTAPPGELTLMLYNGCIKFIHQGKSAIAEKNIEAKNINLQKAQKIIQELMVTLNPKLPLSEELLPLYDYMHRRLIEANIKSSEDILDEVEGLVTGFRDTWKEVILINRQQSQRKVGQA